MKRVEVIPSKTLLLPGLMQKIVQWKYFEKKIAFTNGVFDILHRGHIFSLSQAAREADYLIVGLNSDSSVKRLKGNSRPINDQDSRALILSSLLMIDAVIIFDEDTPLELIKVIMPDVLVKGGDYAIDEVAGAKEVIANGGRVVINPTMEGYSTTAIINAMKQN